MTGDQQALVEKAQASVRAARLMSEEGMHDFAVSRAYYGMFYIAEAFLLERGLHFSSHGAVIAKFGEHFAATGELPAKYHQRLIAAQEKRLAGDYDVNTEVSSEDAATMVEHAEEFITLAESRL